MIRLSILVLSLFFFACSSEKEGGYVCEEIAGNSFLLNFASDFSTGELRWMNPKSTCFPTGALSFAHDSKVSADNGNIFVLSRYPGTLACILPEKIGVQNAIKQNVLESSNPYGAVVVNGKGYIVSWDVDYLQIFNPSTCVPNGKINLPPIAKSYPALIKASGDTLLVVLQRLEPIGASLLATDPGILVLINASTETLIDTIQLKLHNPHSTVLNKGKLYIASNVYNQNNFPDVTKSGIESVDLATGATEVFVTGAQLGGGAIDFALDEANQILYVSVYADWMDEPVKAVDLATKTVSSALPNITDSFGGLVFDNVEKKLFVGDRALKNPTLKVYDPATKTTTAIDEGTNALPPSSLAIVRW